MILTLTLNPALDIFSTVDRVVPVDKLRCDRGKKYPGGGGLNVSRVIHRLGGNTTAVYTLGGHTGEELEELLQQEKIPQDPVEIAGDIRQHLVILDSSTRSLYRFGFPGPELQPAEYKDVLRKLNLYKHADFWVASGSLPPGVPDDFYAQVARKAREKHVKLILDTSGRGFKDVLREGVYLLKPNRKELEDLTGRTARDDQDREAMLLHVLEHFPVEVIVLSLGAEGAILASGGMVRHLPAPAMEPVSSVGAGDSMVAGIAFRLSTGADLAEAVLFGIACGSATLSTPGTELLNPKDVEPLFQGLVDRVGRENLH